MKYSNFRHIFMVLGNRDYEWKDYKDVYLRGFKSEKFSNLNSLNILKV